jgi:hypothetical protein
VREVYCAFPPSEKYNDKSVRMSNPTMEMLFLVISILILFSAVVYWLWSHIQNVSKKAALLEAAIFDLQRLMGAMLRSPEMDGGGTEAHVSGATGFDGSQAPQDIRDVPDVEDLDDVPVADMEDLGSSGFPGFPGFPVAEVEDWTDAPPITSDVPPVSAEPLPVTSDVPPVSAEPLPSSSASVGSAASSSLDSMGLKDLRRLAERRGVASWESLKKKELIQALKSQVTPVSEEETHVLE